MPSNSKPPSGEKFDKMVDRLNEIGREPRAGAIIWHAYIEDLLDWILRDHVRISERLIKKSSFHHKIRVLEKSGVLPEPTVANLYAINEIRNRYAHDIEIETQEFDAKVRGVIERLKWYDEGSFLYEKYNTTLLFSTLANNIYHELHHLYWRS
jgi:hypothetical protein